MHAFGRRTLLSTALATMVAPALAARLPISSQAISGAGVTLNVRDLSSRFLDFYEAAQGVGPDERWRLWKDRYDFAAVPPTSEGDAIARKLLDAAWSRYPAALAAIRAGASGMRPEALPIAVRIADLLEAPRPLAFGLTTYVGGFEENAFTANTDNGPVVSVPLELDEATRAMLLPHEMTHAVHQIVAKLSSGYERTLGRVIFEEGLAMRAVQRFHPGLPDYRYVGDRTWFEASTADRHRILDGLLPHLDERDGETLFRFTMGSGSTGREREAYIAGWLVVGEQLKHRTFGQLARLPEANLPQTVRDIMRTVS